MHPAIGTAEPVWTTQIRQCRPRSRDRCDCHDGCHCRGSITHVFHAQVRSPTGGPLEWWQRFTFIILAISGVETIANLTGIMIAPVERTARRAILPVMIEIAFFNLVLCAAMQALPLETLGNGDPQQAYTAHRDSMLRLLAEEYVSPIFGVVASLIFAFLLLSAGNTALAGMIGIQYTMARDRELPPIFAGLNTYGVAVIPLLLGTLLPIVIILLVPDIAGLADLYAIGVVGAITINLLATATHTGLPSQRWECIGLLALGILMALFALTIAWEKPHALLFATSITVGGFTLRTLRRSTRFQLWWRQHRDILLPTCIPTSMETTLAVPADAAAKPATRILVAIRGGSKLLRFAIEEARNRHAELFLLFVRQLAVIPMGSVTTPDAADDEEAQTLFDEARQVAAQAAVPLRLLYAVSNEVADTILEMAVTYGVDLLILGAPQRGRLWRLMKGDVIQEVAQYLPERITLLIHA